jgi:serine/threonine protein kinase
VSESEPGTVAARPVAFGPFWLERRIAVGGTAEVFVARPKMGEKPAPRLVVKRLVPSIRQSADFGVLQREAALHQAVRHPNVVTVYGAGMVGSEPYIAMEYVPGVDLYRLLRRAESEKREMPSGLAVHIARRVADALSSVHDARSADDQPLNIVHRDITPSNVYLSLDGEVKVGDFGIARASQQLGPTSQASGGLKGKFGYLSPEQVSGEPFDHRADLFSLTVLLGEMLIGEPIFPGSGQLAVLLAIRDVNIEPLRQAASRLSPGLMEVCNKGLSRSPDARYQSAAELCAALEPFDLPEAEARRMLSDWVTWAHDSSTLVRRLEGRIRDSVQRMRAVRLAAAATPPEGIAAQPAPSEDAPKRLSADVVPRVRREGSQQVETVPFPTLLELLATGELSRNDEVALLEGQFQRIGEIEELARHLLPSTTATTSVLFEPGAPDYHAMLHDTSMLEVLARMRRARETGAVFVERRDAQGLRRKEIYLERGRLLHVASSERAELLGEYLVRRGSLTREQLDEALAILTREGGRLGDTLISMGVVHAMDVFRAIRDQGRDRVAVICGWLRGTVTFYRNTAPGQVEFPLDLDLASPMMAGVIVASHGNPRSLLPDGAELLSPGHRAHAATDPSERGTAPISLQVVPRLVAPGARVSVDEALDVLTTKREGRGVRTIGFKEACAALVVARELGWIDYLVPEVRLPVRPA